MDKVCWAFGLIALVAVRGAGAATCFVQEAEAKQPKVEAVAFGARALKIPRPTQFMTLSKDAPDFLALGQAYLPPTSRLVEVYVRPEDYCLLVADQGVELTRYFQLQVMRDVEGKPLSPDTFATASKHIQAGFEEAVRNADQVLKQHTDAGNEAFTKKYGADVNLSVSDVRYLGSFRSEPWAKFFTVSARYAAGDDADRMITALGVALIDHQLLFFNAMAKTDPDGNDGPTTEPRRWAESTVGAWVDAARAANPDDPAVAAQAKPLNVGFDWGRMGFRTLIFALIGGALGFFYHLQQKRKKR